MSAAVEELTLPKIQVSTVNKDTVMRAWVHCNKYLSVAVDKAQGELTLEDALCECLNGTMQLWMVYNTVPEFLGAAVTQLVSYPRFDALRIVLLGGRAFEGWKSELDKAICSAAKGMGCKRVEAFGRAGFVRAMQEDGYSKMYVAIGKEL